MDDVKDRFARRFVRLTDEYIANILKLAKYDTDNAIEALGDEILSDARLRGDDDVDLAFELGFYLLTYGVRKSKEEYEARNRS